MVEATLTESERAPLPGIKKGYCSAQNGYTSKFGFSTLHGVILTPDDDNDCISSCAVSSGQGTIKLVDDAGSDIAADTKLYYLAWGE